MRPRKNCRIALDPTVDYFKPRGIPLYRLKHVALDVEEWEALRLADSQGLSHEEAGNVMGVSRPTFGRILGRARKKVAEALVHGKAIQIAKTPSSPNETDHETRR